MNEQDEKELQRILGDVRRILRLTYNSGAGAEFTNEARMRVNQLLNEVEQIAKKLNLEL